MSLSLLLQSLDLLLRMVALALLAAGGVLIVFPEQTRLRLAVLADERRLPRLSVVAVDRWFYRHHRLLGAGIVLAAAYLLGFLVFQFSREALAAFLASGIEDASARADLTGILHWLLFFGALLAHTVGLILMVRPSALKPIEGWMHAPLPLPGWSSVLASSARARLLGLALATLGIVLVLVA